MTSRRILWADDHIEELRSHILFLQGKGFDVVGASNGDDALDLLQRENFDAVLLDEMMPGRGGLETLAGIRDMGATLPVIMITKSEEEQLMDRALGRRISDYLVKPVNPTQILMALKRALDSPRITEEQVTQRYLQGFGQMATARTEARTFDDWAHVYERMVDWDLELNRLKDPQLAQMHTDQMRDANTEFCRFVEKNYADWIAGADDAPVLSHELVPRFVEPHLRDGKRVILVVIDCMRLDQWKAIESVVEPFYSIRQDLYCGLLPSATPFARNALFAGMLPRDIAERHPQWWRGSAQEERSKNAFEKELLIEQLRRRGLGDTRTHYFRTFNINDTEQLRKKVPTLKNANLIAAVVNFLDILAHGRSQNDLLQELAPDQAAFRSVMRSWFEHSALLDLLRDLATWEDTVVVVTTDHGAVQVRKGVTVKAKREASTNVRYKYGDNLNLERKGEAIDVRDPASFGLPKDGPIQNYLLARDYDFFVYPTNQNDYVRQFTDSFQHGGVSLEELVVPVVTLRPR